MKARPPSYLHRCDAGRAGQHPVGPRQLWFMEREACRWAEAEHEGAIVQRELLALPDGPCEVSAFTRTVLSDDPQQV